MNAKHTPEEWKVEPDGLSVITSSGWLIMFQPTRAAVVRPRETREANARLIAAAPELLEALKSVHGYLVDMSKRPRTSFANCRAGSDADELLPIVEKALAKAEGR